MRSLSNQGRRHPLAEYESADRDRLEALGQRRSTSPPLLLAIALLLTRLQVRQSQIEDDRSGSPRLSISAYARPFCKPFWATKGHLRPGIPDYETVYDGYPELPLPRYRISCVVWESKYGLESFGETGR